MRSHRIRKCCNFNTLGVSGTEKKDRSQGLCAAAVVRFLVHSFLLLPYGFIWFSTSCLRPDLMVSVWTTCCLLSSEGGAVCIFLWFGPSVTRVCSQVWGVPILQISGRAVAASKFFKLPLGMLILYSQVQGFSPFLARCRRVVSEIVLRQRAEWDKLIATNRGMSQVGGHCFGRGLRSCHWRRCFLRQRPDSIKPIPWEKFLVSSSCGSKFNATSFQVMLLDVVHGFFCGQGCSGRSFQKFSVRLVDYAQIRQGNIWLTERIIF